MQILLFAEMLHRPAEAQKHFALGLHLLARAVAAAPDLADCVVDVVEGSTLSGEHRDSAVARRYDLVGFSCHCWDLEDQLHLADRVKERWPETVVVLGGPSASIERVSILERARSVDAIVVGEGETAFVELVRALRAGRGPEGLAGVATHARPNPPPVALLEEVPLPFAAAAPPRSEYYVMETMRGCVFRCAYCAWARPGPVRYFPPSYVEANLRYALEAGYRKAMIVDPAINFADGQLQRLAGSVRRADPGRKLGFFYFLQWSSFHDGQMKSLEALGVDTAYVGLVSANPAALEAAGRPWDEARVRATLRAISSIATPVVDVILGLPGDTVDGFLRTLDFVDSLDATVMAFRLVLYPGSEYHARARELGFTLRPGRIPFVAEAPGFSRDDIDRLSALMEQRVSSSTQRGRFFFEPVDYWDGEDAPTRVKKSPRWDERTAAKG